MPWTGRTVRQVEDVSGEDADFLDAVDVIDDDGSELSRDGRCELFFLQGEVSEIKVTRKKLITLVEKHTSVED
ncbi:hypothetical protein [Deinococcus pimensis]|uniref:hypothetical protein n=1 Tax=Deinococcus pimensis TaxID=309888 RepID=UPI000488C9FD|nr:hypothetical protein [Deinococcus pimensis]